MKILFVFYGLLSSLFSGGGGFYNETFQTVSGTTVNTDAYQGKKVMIVVIDAANPDVAQLRFLDSVQTNSSNKVIVVAVPTEDFGGTANLSLLKNVQQSLTLVITKPIKVKKNAGAGQHAIFNWLTSTKANNHFDNNVEGAGQLFIVSAKGTLYSVLSKDTPREAVRIIINQAFNE